VSTGVLPA